MLEHIVDSEKPIDDGKIRRKMQVVNVAAFIASLGFGFTAFYQFQLGPDWRYLAWVNFGLGFAALLTMTLDRFGLEVKVAYFTVWLFLFLAHDISVGKNGEDHLVLLVGPPLLFYFLGAAYWRWITLITILSAALFIYISLVVPLHIPPGETIWDIVKQSYQDGFVRHPQDVIFIVLILGIVSALFFTSYSANAAIDRYEEALEKEFAVSERLINVLLPSRIAKRIKAHPDRLIAERIDDATILFSDLSGFSEFAAANGARATVKLLGSVFSAFDELVLSYKLEKIKTIGDSYMVAGGLDPSVKERQPDSVRMAALAIDMIATVERVSDKLHPKVSLRVGIHKGPVIAGVIGGDKPFFDVWGDTVNIASRMESSGEPGRVQISPEVRDEIAEHVDCDRREVINIKGYGEIQPYWLGKVHDEPAISRASEQFIKG
ncbi:adenylate/guanylate cyclase domain-containing protein [Ruegeria atlantica]|uniref:adenylate/guanylate cyclase domain-containing protein n=1 Tax=Ruegeria atlantica TaxID=81569 RepID=UPI00147C75F6|nr:adenylate/guanylate cyclase domain-containing protein [Ruegeria atlantica]